MKAGKYFHLHASCMPVKGVKRSIICDLQRDTYELIPNVLHTILTRYARKSISDIKQIYNNEQDEMIDGYFNFLAVEEYGCFMDDISQFRRIKPGYNDPRPLNNAIVDFDAQSAHDLLPIVQQLSQLYCAYLELRFYYSPDLAQLTELLRTSLADCSFRSVEILLGENEATPFSSEELQALLQASFRIKKLTIHSAHKNACIENQDHVLIHTIEPVLSETCCGVISPYLFISKTELYMESLIKNNCLHKKISVDRKGYVKNCPGMLQHFGHISEVQLAEVLTRPAFQQVWEVAKSQISDCKVCEFRYICQDCRAYRKDPSDPYSKPAKCKYDPYEANWQE